jgi:hypothetical protein
MRQLNPVEQAKLEHDLAVIASMEDDDAAADSPDDEDEDGLEDEE